MQVTYPLLNQIKYWIKLITIEWNWFKTIFWVDIIIIDPVYHTKDLVVVVEIDSQTTFPTWNPRVGSWYLRRRRKVVLGWVTKLSCVATSFVTGSCVAKQENDCIWALSVYRTRMSPNLVNIVTERWQSQSIYHTSLQNPHSG